MNDSQRIIGQTRWPAVGNAHQTQVLRPIQPLLRVGFVPKTRQFLTYSTLKIKTPSLISVYRNMSGPHFVNNELAFTASRTTRAASLRVVRLVLMRLFLPPTRVRPEITRKALILAFSTPLNVHRKAVRTSPSVVAAAFKAAKTFNPLKLAAQHPLPPHLQRVGGVFYFWIDAHPPRAACKHAPTQTSSRKSNKFSYT